MNKRKKISTILIAYQRMCRIRGHNECFEATVRQLHCPAGGGGGLAHTSFAAKDGQLARVNGVGGWSGHTCGVCNRLEEPQAIHSGDFRVDKRHLCHLHCRWFLTLTTTAATTAAVLLLDK